MLVHRCFVHRASHSYTWQFVNKLKITLTNQWFRQIANEKLPDVYTFDLSSSCFAGFWLYRARQRQVHGMNDCDAVNEKKNKNPKGWIGLLEWNAFVRVAYNNTCSAFLFQWNRPMKWYMLADDSIDIYNFGHSLQTEHPLFLPWNINYFMWKTINRKFFLWCNVYRIVWHREKLLI